MEDDTAGHPLVGTVTGDATVSDGSRLADHFHTECFVLLDHLDGTLAAVGNRWSERVATVVKVLAIPDCPESCWALAGLLVRPDGVIAWAAETTDFGAATAGVHAALIRWAGAASRNLEVVTPDQEGQ